MALEAVALEAVVPETVAPESVAPEAVALEVPGPLPVSAPAGTDLSGAGALVNG